MTERKLHELAAFGPIFRDPTTTFGRWHPSQGKGTEDDPTTFPYFEFSETATRFMRMLQEAGWIQNFNWIAWAHGTEGQKLVREPGAIAGASPDQLAKLLTAFSRQERFCDGALADAYERGTLRAIVERAEALARGPRQNGESRL